MFYVDRYFQAPVEYGWVLVDPVRQPIERLYKLGPKVREGWPWSWRTATTMVVDTCM
jgi:hypothetical protein